MQELEKLTHEMDVQMQLAEESMGRVADVRKVKEKVRRQKLREIEREVKKGKMERMGQMLMKLQRQAEVVGRLQVEERSVRMRLKNKLT